MVLEFSVNIILTKTKKNNNPIKLTLFFFSLECERIYFDTNYLDQYKV